MKYWKLVICFLFIVRPCFATDARPVLSESERTALVSAIEDEIYDYGFQEEFRSVGHPISAEEFEIPLFVTKAESSYYVIYRLLPFGEMYRLVNFGSDGMVRLFRNPRSGFPPDAPAMLTLYFDDDEMCDFKHNALRLSFVVEMKPSKQRIEEAITRQKKRYGFSNLEEERMKKKKHHR